MEDSIGFDENVPDEVLDERVSRSSSKNSLYCNSFVSMSPFQKERRRKSFAEAEAFSFGLKPKIHPNRGQMKKQVKNEEPISSKSVGLQRCPERSSLQDEIKDLLHKAMHIRSKFYYESDREICPKAIDLEWARFHSFDSHSSLPNNKDSNGREVTMNDVESS
ncbi:unnamed protein product [Moneuplotes crassus]|uniref:Uncharacterized protein n=1 Tax=Euplotes crassus TaxID=5936 RepID=A0AAD1UK65_EUPCR|nr:unnamed protein product [Moneuplotes crassus]